MKEQSFWQLLRDKHNDLTKSGRLVADYLVQHPEEAQYLSISSLAKACGVAEATIFRFCRSLTLTPMSSRSISPHRSLQKSCVTIRKSI